MPFGFLVLRGGDLDINPDLDEESQMPFGFLVLRGADWQKVNFAAKPYVSNAFRLFGSEGNRKWKVLVSLGAVTSQMPFGFLVLRG